MTQNSCIFRISWIWRRIRFLVLTLCVSFIAFYSFGMPNKTVTESEIKDNDMMYTSRYSNEVNEKMVEDDIIQRAKEEDSIASLRDDTEKHDEHKSAIDKAIVPDYLKTTDSTSTIVPKFAPRFVSQQTTGSPSEPQRPSESQKQQQQTQILVVTYLRSGSTLTADIIQKSTDVFYIYEPFHSFPQHVFYTESQICNITTGECRNPTSVVENPDIIAMNLINIFNCQFQNLTKRIFMDMRFNAKRSVAHRQYDECRKVRGLRPCNKKLESLCRTKSYVSVKVIKVTMEIAEWLMKSLPNLKIVLLLRDPRGMIASRMAGGYVKKDTVSSVARITCNRMRNDINSFKRIREKFPRRVLPVLYEIIAEDPILATHKLYNFLGLSLTKNITDYVFNITKSGNNNNGYFNIIRRDSAKTAYNWRSKLKWDSVKQIDQECTELYKLTGFRDFQSQNNYFNSSYKSLIPNSMFTT